MFRKQNPLLRLALSALACALVTACSGQASPAAKTTTSGPAATGAVSPEHQQALKDWEAVTTAAKQERELVWSVTQAQDWQDAVAKQFQDTYDIQVHISVTRPPDMLARFTSELAAGKPTMDIRTGGNPFNRDLDSKDLTLPIGTIPAQFEPESTWITDPFQDIKAGEGQSVAYSISPNYLLANNKLCPPENCPKGYKDLADPKYKGMLLLDEPIPGGSPGTRFVAYAYLEYGEEYIKNVMANVAAVSRSGPTANQQVARGEYAMYVHTNSIPNIWELPKPHPFRLIVPDDGQMVLVQATSILKGAPHPNAAKLFTNFLLTREAQQTMASFPSVTFLRNDVTPSEPELVKFSPKLFPRNPDTVAFGATYFQYAEFSDKYLVEFGKK